MRRGEELSERAPDLEATVAEYFGPVTGTREVDGDELYVVAEPDNPAFEEVLAGAAVYSGKKDRLKVHFEERPAEELLEAGEAESAADAVNVKNEFLLEVTGRDAKSRRESMKREVEDDETPEGVE